MWIIYIITYIKYMKQVSTHLSRSQKPTGFARYFASDPLCPLEGKLLH